MVCCIPDMIIQYFLGYELDIVTVLRKIVPLDWLDLTPMIIIIIPVVFLVFLSAVGDISLGICLRNRI